MSMHVMNRVCMCVCMHVYLRERTWVRKLERSESACGGWCMRMCAPGCGTEYKCGNRKRVSQRVEDGAHAYVRLHTGQKISVE